jgi:hypothetical protein
MAAERPETVLGKTRIGVTELHCADEIHILQYKAKNKKKCENLVVSETAVWYIRFMLSSIFAHIGKKI